ncbi:transcription factor bHLH63 isoform X2 [Manihot esculenta]|uniref:BHLH domain-containing protein n=3 Tax=Manihot esculenta TaxID=3983 RepID=A0A2C9W3C4_MANES|nr:transcription factor bHLH63 isoform X2 [Manihot esculenta]KAG8655987.1 hypothetical protein MANES_04G088800v8 [Manihot esculenta]KAG8655991.1 hypothetical protein MANES_04G088800v8 [Manihot esculenta]OAY52502.1 hypothetical protein MANES_04G088800v8 [Manihot esculenta]
MNRALLPEMLHCTDMTVLERQRARFKWQQEQELQQQQQQHHQQESFFGDLSGVFQLQLQHQGLQGDLGEVVTRSVKPDPASMDNGWPGLVGFGPSGYENNNGSGFDVNYAISRTSSCQPAVAGAAVDATVLAESREPVMSEKLSPGVGRENLKKRKVDKLQHNTKVVAEDESRDKRVKGCAGEGESMNTEKNNNKSSSTSKNSTKENSAETSKDNSKVTEVQKPDYIHVRARRGQATDSHSLAERVRREKISERMKYLQDLVPGCNKITGKAGMLDEIINYVQSLQRQVEFLSMKLAAVNPRLEFNIDNVFAKEAFPAPTTNFPETGMSSDLTNPVYLQFNQAQQQQQQQQQQLFSSSGSIPEMFIDPSCFTHIQPSSTWDAVSDLQKIFTM